MLSDVVHRHDTVRGNTLTRAKRLSVNGGHVSRNTVQTLGRISGGNLEGVEPEIKPGSRGVCGRVLKSRIEWEGSRGYAAAANRTRESRPSGMRGGLAETLAMVELGTHCTNRKGA